MTMEDCNSKFDEIDFYALQEAIRQEDEVDVEEEAIAKEIEAEAQTSQVNEASSKKRKSDSTPASTSNPTGTSTETESEKEFPRDLKKDPKQKVLAFQPKRKEQGETLAAVCFDHELYKKCSYLDVCTRWNSTYLMLESALKFKSAFGRLEDTYGDFLLEFGGEVTGERVLPLLLIGRLHLNLLNF
ncbi:zinc finger BED domain-containing protein RICESLEEPER 2-like [Senna tora]|uniref:Zinc finger BED domain-containing protein RICESLEEPER 2-like n=1 Tax=Senna tora TaxID=362788 RepID=A0A835CHC0_9FABA|nr:zinc finger BED domain-containing protein RICESLEEPER 2-like [Senna tora]